MSNAFTDCFKINQYKCINFGFENFIQMIILSYVWFSNCSRIIKININVETRKIFINSQTWMKIRKTFITSRTGKKSLTRVVPKTYWLIINLETL